MRKLLGENKLAYLVINYVDTKRISQEDLDKIIQVDSTSTKKFTEWIINQFITNPGVERSYNQLANSIKVYKNYPDIFKNFDFKKKSIDEFILDIKSEFKQKATPEQSPTVEDMLSKYKVGMVMGHKIYIINKGASDVSTLFHSIPNISEDIIQFGPVVYIVGNGNAKYLMSFSTDTYVDHNGNSIPIKTQNVAIWDSIFTWIYTNKYITEDIIACIDLFGKSFENSKLSKAIESNNPKEVFGKYYSNQSNKLLNVIVNTNTKAVSDYSKYVDKFKNLGFGIKGTLIDIDLGSADLAELKSSISEENYEANVKAHFKRTGQSFDTTTFGKIKDSFNSNATLYFLVLRDTNPQSGIFLESGNSIVGFVDKSELAHLMNKFHTARKIESLITQVSADNEEKRKEYDTEMKHVQDDVKKIINQSKSLKHYIIV